MFLDLIERHAGNTLVDSDEGRLTYGEALAMGDAVIAGLPRARSLVVLRCALDHATIATHLALVARGHVPLLLERSLSAPLTNDLIARYRPDAVIDAGEARLTGNAPVEIHPDLGLLLATSGSTGSPKLVRQSKRGVRANAQAIAEYLGLDAGERPLLHLPLSYSYGLSILHSHIVAGAAILPTTHAVMEPGYWNDLADRRATSIAGVPFHYMAIRRFGEAKLEIPSLKTLTQAGGRLDPRIIAWFAEWAGRTDRRFVVMYGQTEAGPRVTWLPPDRAAEAPDSIGVPIPGVSIRFVDEDGHEVPDGEPGEMRIDSPSVMMGYALEPDDLARGDDLRGVLATGDVAVKGADGLLRIVGRRSRMLKIFGLRVNLDEVEQRLSTLGHAALVGGKDDALCILLEAGGDPAGVRAQVVELFSLPPRGIQVRAGGPVARSAAGKVRAADFDAAWEGAVP